MVVGSVVFWTGGHALKIVQDEVWTDSADVFWVVSGEVGWVSIDVREAFIVTSCSVSVRELETGAAIFDTLVTWRLVGENRCLRTFFDASKVKSEIRTAGFALEAI